MRTFEFKFTVMCEGQGDADEAEVERLIDLAMQDLVYDDTFIASLDEQTSVTIQVERTR